MKESEIEMEILDYKSNSNYRHSTIQRKIKPNKKNTDTSLIDLDQKLSNQTNSESNDDENDSESMDIKEKNKLNIDEEEQKREEKNEKNRKKLNDLNSFEKMFIYLFKKIPVIRENKMKYQIYIGYLLLLIILVLLLITVRKYIIQNNFNRSENKNFFINFTKDTINTQNNLKNKVDTKNNNNIMQMTYEELLFFEIYTQELSLHNIYTKDIFTLENLNIETYENELGDNFIPTLNISTYINSTEEYTYNIRNLLPFYYHISPILYQFFNDYGMDLINFYFIGNIYNCRENDIINNFYFKYPLEENTIWQNYSPQNDKIYNYIIDPFIECNSGYNTYSKTLLNLIKKNNWYYNTINDINNYIPFKLIEISTNNQVNNKKTYDIATNKFFVNYNDEDIVFSFVIRTSKDNIKWPFIITNDYNSTLYYDFLSLTNFYSYEKYFIINDNDYDIDTSQNLFLRIPKFINNMISYSLDENFDSNNNFRLLENFNEEINPKTANNIKYNQINNIINYYNLSYYFTSDILYFKLIYFFNGLLLYKQNNPSYLSQNDTSISNLSQHPCSISDIDNYYILIKNNFNYDCIYDYCFFHNCQTIDKIYKDESEKVYMPNCYCMPLFCKDNFTQNNSLFEESIKNKLYKSSDIDYSFTSNYEYYKNEREYFFSEIDKYFNRNDFSFKCQLKFNKKNIDENKTFNTKFNLYSLTKTNSTFLMSYIYNNSTLSKIIDAYHSSNQKYFVIFTLIYFFIIIIIAIELLVYVLFLLNKLTNRMEKFIEIRKSVISDANKNINNKNDDEEKEDHKHNKNDENMNLITNDDKTNNKTEKLIDNEDKNNEEENKKIKNKEKNNINEKNEIDELDELIKLIYDNISTFKIEFNINENFNNFDIQKQYNEIIKVNKYKNKLLLKENKDQDQSFDDKNDECDSFSIKGNENEKDLSISILNELFSLSTSEMDFSNIKPNFYFKEKGDNSLYDLNMILKKINEGENGGNYDIANIDKLKNAIEHYYNNIHDYWKKYYDLQKNKDEI